MRLNRRIFWFVFVLLWLGAAALWMRSYWRTDDIFLIYRSDGSEHLRIHRGLVFLIHTSSESPDRRLAVQRVSTITSRGGWQPGDMFLPKSYPTHRQWLSFSFDSISSAQIASMQSAHAANVLRANQAAFAAMQASYSAENRFEDALSAGARSENPALRQNVRITYWQFQAAREHAMTTRAAQLQITSAGVPSLVPQWQVTFPAWLLLAIASIPIAILLWRAQAKRRRIQQGLCGHCGYDLHGNTSGICPECGTPLAIVLCRSITVDGKRVLSIKPAVPATAIGSR